MMWIPVVFGLLILFMLWHTARSAGITKDEWKAFFIEIIEVSKELSWQDMYRILIYDVFGGATGILLAMFIGLVVGFTLGLYV